jgi:predicted nucleotidyltransferase
MRSTIDHLPETKTRELAYVVEVIRSGFEAATARRTQARFRGGKLLKIILFGSYARGDRVEDPVGRYSDYDLLVVVDREELTDVAEFWDKTESRLLSDLTVGTGPADPGEPDLPRARRCERQASAWPLLLHGHPQGRYRPLRGTRPRVRRTATAV